MICEAPCARSLRTHVPEGMQGAAGPVACDASRCASSADDSSAASAATTGVEAADRGPQCGATSSASWEPHDSSMHSLGMGVYATSPAVPAGAPLAPPRGHHGVGWEGSGSAGRRAVERQSQAGMRLDHDEICW